MRHFPSFSNFEKENLPLPHRPTYHHSTFFFWEKINDIEKNPCLSFQRRFSCVANVLWFIFATPLMSWEVIVGCLRITLGLTGKTCFITYVIPCFRSNSCCCFQVRSYETDRSVGRARGGVDAARFVFGLPVWLRLHRLLQPRPGVGRKKVRTSSGLLQSHKELV